MPQKSSLRDTLYLTENPDESTFKYDQSLPNLPVPTIEKSINKLIETIKPIVIDDAAFKETEKRAMAFIQDPEVKELQELLKKRAQLNKNWLEEYWLEFAYLRSRKPLIPYSNMSAPLPVTIHWPIVQKQQTEFECIRSQRAALSTYFQLCFWRMLRHEQMRPMIHKGVPWSMNQFRYLFNTVRRPNEPKDELLSWFKTVKDGMPESVEIIVLHRGYIFSIKPVTMIGPQKACILSAPQIERQLRYIEKWCQDRPFGPGVASLTTNERSVWKEARDELSRVSDRNKQLLRRIEQALSVLVFDDNEPINTEEIFKLSMCGDSQNRWADKSITTIAFKNGTFGANADHTPYDGFCTGIMTHYIITSVKECNGEWSDELGSTSNSSWANYNEPELLEFQLSPLTKISINESVQHFESVCSTIDVIHRTFSHFGKALLKEHRFHPEAFIQCAIHAAYYRQHKRMAPAYVTASTRRFFNGRTETCRSCYPEMKDFSVFLNQYGTSKHKEAYELLQKSVQRFQILMDEASLGQGCDRHLLGLYLMAMFEGKKIPDLFEDELVLKTNNYILSTSCAGYWNVCGGVPPLVEEGYGCFYGIEDDEITFACTAYKSCADTDLRGFYENLNLVLTEMQKLMLCSKL